MAEVEVLPPLSADSNEFIQSLTNLYSKAHTREQAQFVLGLIAIRRLSRSDRVWVRNLLVAPYPDAPKEGRQIAKEASSKEWIRRFLDRLLSRGYIRQKIQGTTIMYRGEPEQKEVLTEVVSNALQGNGAILKELLGHIAPAAAPPTSPTPPQQADEPYNLFADADTDEDIFSENEIPEMTTTESPTISAINDYIQSEYTVNEEKDGARFVLSLVAIHRLCATSALDRKQLMAPYSNLKPSKAVKKELTKADWFKPVLDRLVQQGLADQDGKSGASLLYRTSEDQRQTLRRIILDTLESDGSLLKAIIWPSEYQGLEMVAPAPALVEVQEEAPDQEGLDIVKDYADQLKTVAAHLQGLFDGLTALSSKMDERMDRLEAIEGKVDTAFNRLIEAVEKDERTNLAVIADRFIEIHNRRKSLSNQLDQETQRMEKTYAEMSTLLSNDGVKKLLAKMSKS